MSENDATTTDGSEDAGSEQVLVHTNTFEAPVATVFESIADSAKHSAFTGAPAELASEPGGAFTTHGGAIEGWILDRAENERLVQAWRPADWPAGVYRSCAMTSQPLETKPRSR